MIGQGCVFATLFITGPRFAVPTVLFRSVVLSVMLPFQDTISAYVA